MTIPGGIIPLSATFGKEKEKPRMKTGSTACGSKLCPKDRKPGEKSINRLNRSCFTSKVELV
jgi:hypothetical protein